MQNNCDKIVGVFCVSGVALIAEGFMSAFYHVCPNDTNFQFGEYTNTLMVCEFLHFYFTDTAFMFIIAGLGIYQLFHNRHPGFTPNAHILYLSFAVLIFFAFMGTLFPETAFWIIMVILHLLWIVFMSFQFYYNGVIKCSMRSNMKCLNWDVAKKLLCDSFQQIPSLPGSIEKFIYVVFLNIVNVVM